MMTIYIFKVEYNETITTYIFKVEHNETITILFLLLSLISLFFQIGLDYPFMVSFWGTICHV